MTNHLAHTLATLSKEQLVENLLQLQAQYMQEQKRSAHLTAQLQAAKEQTLVVQQQVEQEEECITNALLKRLEQLRKEKQTLSNEVEQQESYLVNTLQRRLDKVAAEKAAVESQLAVLSTEKRELRDKLSRSTAEKTALENELEYEQEYIVNKLQKKLMELTAEKTSLSKEKIELENQLEQEQEFIVNKLRKQLEQLSNEKATLGREKAQLQTQVQALASSVHKLNCDKVELENTLEAEEEHIVNKLQRQLETITTNFKMVEARLESLGVASRDLGLVPLDNTTEWVYTRSPSRTISERTSFTQSSIGPYASAPLPVGGLEKRADWTRSLSRTSSGASRRGGQRNSLGSAPPELAQPAISMGTDAADLTPLSNAVGDAAQG